MAGGRPASLFFKMESFPMNATIRHEAARKLAYELVGIIAPCLRQEEQFEALREFYETIRAGLDDYDARSAGLPSDRQRPKTDRHVGG